MAFKPLTVNTPPAQAAHILAEDDAAIYGGLLGQDCVLPLGQKLKATVISNNKVRIADGVVSVGGHIGRVISGDYEDMTITNGVSGKKRNDIIAARFIAGASGGSDTYKLVVIQGTAGATASDPVTVKGDLYSGDKQRDYPLWRVKIEGLSIVKVEQMYKVGVSDAELLERMTEMNRSLTEEITALNSSLAHRLGNSIHTADNRVGISSDSEGGNIWLYSHTNKQWEFDAYDGENLRLYTDNGNISFDFKQNGDLYYPYFHALLSECLNAQNAEVVDALEFPDCLAVDLTKRYSTNNLNKIIYHRINIDISGFPQELTKNLEFSVLRELIWSSDKHLFVKLTCYYVTGQPDFTGTTWYIAYTKNEGWGKWIKK